MSVAPDLDSIEVGRSTTFTAEAVDDADVALPSWSATWTSSRQTVATVIDSGTTTRATGTGPGAAEVTADVGGVTATADLVVVLPLQSINGAWTASSIAMTVAVTEQATGRLVGSGTVLANGVSYNVSMEGERDYRDVRMGFVVPGFQNFSFNGTYRVSSMSGRLNGSGFNNAPVTLSRQ